MHCGSGVGPSFSNKILFVHGTADFHMMCKFNKSMALDSIRIIDLFERKKCISIQVDFNYQDY